MRSASIELLNNNSYYLKYILIVSNFEFLPYNGDNNSSNLQYDLLMCGNIDLSNYDCEQYYHDL